MNEDDRRKEINEGLFLPIFIGRYIAKHLSKLFGKKLPSELRKNFEDSTPNPKEKWEKEEKTREDIIRSDRPYQGKGLKKAALGMASIPAILASYIYFMDKEYFVESMTKPAVIEFYDKALMEQGKLETISYNFGPLFGIAYTIGAYFFIDFCLHFAKEGTFGSYTAKKLKELLGRNKDNSNKGSLGSYDTD